MEYITKNAAGTQEAGEKLGSSLEGGEVLALTGPLGSGKTTFVQGLAKGLGLTRQIISPTFIIVREYEIPNQNQRGNLYHVDLYRLEGDLEREIVNLGLRDIWSKSENVVVIEWAEKIKELLPEKARWVRFEYTDEDERKINIEK